MLRPAAGDLRRRWKKLASAPTGKVATKRDQSIGSTATADADSYRIVKDLACLDKVYAHASYVTVNISSPNTQGLRTLQSGDALAALLEPLKNRQSQLASQHGRYVPLAVVFGFGVITDTPGLTRSSQSRIPFGFPFRTIKTIVEVYGELLCGRRDCQFLGSRCAFSWTSSMS